jgi:hypothetical protein
MYRALREFQGGRVAVAVGVPHKCPIAPVEVMFALNDYFKARGIRDKVQPQVLLSDRTHHTIENVAKWAKPEFDKMGVEYETLFNIREVDAKNKILKSEEGTEVNYDMLIVIPQHRGMEVIERDNMGQGGWIPTDRYKLTMNGHDNVYVVGDTTNLPVSKTGSAAHFQAEVVAENIASIVKIGAPVRDYDGKVYCFIEAGHEKATYAMFNYLNPPTSNRPQTHALVQAFLQPDVLDQRSRLTLKRSNHDDPERNAHAEHQRKRPAAPGGVCPACHIGTGRDERRYRQSPCFDDERRHQHARSPDAQPGLAAPVARNGPAGEPVFPDLHVQCLYRGQPRAGYHPPDRRRHWRPAQVDQRSGHPGRLAPAGLGCVAHEQWSCAILHRRGLGSCT